MRLRKVDDAGDYVWGHNQLDFWTDVPDGPAQLVASRLNLWKGQWFLDTADGTDYNVRVLGKYTGLTRDAEIKQRALNTDGVLSIAAYSSQLNEVRQWSAEITLVTQFGAVLLQTPT